MSPIDVSTIETLAAQIGHLRNLQDASDRQFDDWRQDVVAALQGVCGVGSSRVRDFQAIGFGPPMFGGNDEKHQALLRGIDRAEKLLQQVVVETRPLKPSLVGRLATVSGRAWGWVVAFVAVLGSLVVLLTSVGALRHSEDHNDRLIEGAALGQPFRASAENCRDSCIQSRECRAWNSAGTVTIDPEKPNCWHFATGDIKEKVQPGYLGGVVKWKYFQE
jgi:hypothetical protein